MAKVKYVKCSLCHKDYYLNASLYRVVSVNPKQKLRCPYCKNYFFLNKSTIKEA